MEDNNSYYEKRQLIFGRTMSIINESFNEEGAESSRYDRSRSHINSASHICTDLVELDSDIAEEEGISLP